MEIELKGITNRNLTPFVDVKLQKISTNEIKTLDEWLNIGNNESLYIREIDGSEIQKAREEEINQQIGNGTVVDISNNKTFQEIKIGDKLKVQLIPLDIRNTWINSECFFKLMDGETFEGEYGDGSFSNFLDITNSILVNNYSRKEIIIDLVIKDKKKYKASDEWGKMTNIQPRYEIKNVQLSLRQKDYEKLEKRDNFFYLCKNNIPLSVYKRLSNIPYLITKQNLNDYGYNKEIEIGRLTQQTKEMHLMALENQTQLFQKQLKINELGKQKKDLEGSLNEEQSKNKELKQELASQNQIMIQFKLGKEKASKESELNNLVELVKERLKRNLLRDNSPTLVDELIESQDIFNNNGCYQSQEKLEKVKNKLKSRIKKEVRKEVERICQLVGEINKLETDLQKLLKQEQHFQTQIENIPF